MGFSNRIWKALGVAVVAVLALSVAYQQRSGPELTIGTVNNADMILMQRLSQEFEKASGRQAELGGAGREASCASA